VNSENMEAELMHEMAQAVPAVRRDPIGAREASNARLDAATKEGLAETPVPLACRKGCSWCCHFRVDAQPDEVLLIHRYAADKLPASIADGIAARARAAAKRIAAMTSDEHMATNIACAFLVDGACAVYPVRPSRCRAFHSTDEAVCRQSYEHPEADPPLEEGKIADIFDRAQLRVSAAMFALEKAGKDSSTYELQTAYVEALDNPRVYRWLSRGQRVFFKAVRLAGRVPLP
jgi:Fe-S-cluster containining protein